jgi:amidohydrolase
MSTMKAAVGPGTNGTPSPTGPAGVRPVATTPPRVDPDLARALEAELDAAVELRHTLHREARLSGDEADTRDAVLAALADLPGLGAAEAVAGTGTLLRIGTPPGEGPPAVAVRAELDALPVVERTGLPFSADGPAAHVCGHDVHVAALVAVVRAVAGAGADRLPAPLLAVFQPREESAPSGAGDIAVDPVFLAHGAGAMLGVHVQPELPRGVVSVRGGPVNASSDEVEITVHGRGGHGGYPHRTRDPVLTLAQVVVSLHHVVSRQVDPLAAGVITIGRMQAGSAPNVVPETASAYGTVRALDADRDALLDAVRTVAVNTAASYGCTAEVAVVPNEPAVVNDEPLARTLAAALGRNRGSSRGDHTATGLVLDTTFRSCGADDFSHYGDVLPSAMLFVGTTEDGTAPGSGPGLHHPEFSPDDAMVGEVARALLVAVTAAGTALAAPDGADTTTPDGPDPTDGADETP